jgi:SAM-dependent methyltransferase
MTTAHPTCVALRQRLYDERGWQHPYRRYRCAVADHLTVGRSILEIGCGRTFPLAGEWLKHTDTVCGVDPEVDPGAVDPPARVLAATAERLPFQPASFDVVACRSVLEHLPQPRSVMDDVARVLKPGGVFIFLTPSRYDYVSFAARLIPSAWHGRILRWLEGRSPEDTFTTYYRANSRSVLQRLAAQAGLRVVSLSYLNHHPAYFMGSPLLYRLATLYDRLVCCRAALDFLRGWLMGVLKKPVRDGDVNGVQHGP